MRKRPHRFPGRAVSPGRVTRKRRGAGRSSVPRHALRPSPAGAVAQSWAARLSSRSGAPTLCMWLSACRYESIALVSVYRTPISRQ